MKFILDIQYQYPCTNSISLSYFQELFISSEKFNKVAEFIYMHLSKNVESLNGSYV